MLVCNKCVFLNNAKGSLCPYCMKAKSDRHRRRYYALGPVKQLEKDMQELQRYRDLCSYEQIADLLGHTDNLDHCDELNIS